MWSQPFWVKSPDIHPGKVFSPEGLIAWRPIYKTTFSHSGYTLRRQEWFDLTSDVHLRFAHISSLVALLGWLRAWTWVLRRNFRRKFCLRQQNKRYQNDNIAKYSITQWITNTWNILKCGAGGGWRRSVGPIVWKMKKCYLQSRRREISYIQ
jgi:hypothetical protein